MTTCRYLKMPNTLICPKATLFKQQTTFPIWGKVLPTARQASLYGTGATLGEGVGALSTVAMAVAVMTPSMSYD